MESKPYVAHWCKNRKCTSSWMDKDETNVKTRPPQHKYCIDCIVAGFENKKDPAKVARGKALAAARQAKKEKFSALEGL